MDKIQSLISQLYQNSPSHCFCCDPEYHVLWSNRRDSSVSNIEKLPELFHKQELQEALLVLKQGQSYELIHRNFSQQKLVYHLSPFMEEEQLKIILVILETEEKKSKEDRSFYDFYASVSAEYRAPLFGIFNYLNLLNQNLEEKEMYDDIEIINSIAYHCYKILRTTLNTSAFYLLKGSDSPLNLRPVNMNLYLENLCSSIRMRLQNTEIQFQYELESQQINTMIDTEKFDLLIFNILSNSCTYTNPGNEIKLTMKKSDTSYIITISDKGVGIPNEHLKKIFEDFYSYDINKDSTNGIGIGLYLVNAIVKAHGGSCIVNSTVNEGTTISLRFPIIDTRTHLSEMRSPATDYLSNKFSPLYVFLGEISGYHVF